MLKRVWSGTGVCQNFSLNSEKERRHASLNVLTGIIKWVVSTFGKYKIPEDLWGNYKELLYQITFVKNYSIILTLQRLWDWEKRELVRARFKFMLYSKAAHGSSGFHLIFHILCFTKSWLAAHVWVYGTVGFHPNRQRQIRFKFWEEATRWYDQKSTSQTHTVLGLRLEHTWYSITYSISVYRTISLSICQLSHLWYLAIIYSVRVSYVQVWKSICNDGNPSSVDLWHINKVAVLVPHLTNPNHFVGFFFFNHKNNQFLASDMEHEKCCWCGTKNK